MKYYVTADIHGFYTEFHRALDEAGYFTDPEPHKLIILGDIFDRGQEAVAMQRFILQLMDEDAVILVLTAGVFYAGYRLMASQYPMRDAFFGINYTRIREMLPALQVVIPPVSLLCIFLCGAGFRYRGEAAADLAGAVILALCTWGGVKLSYDKDSYEVLAKRMKADRPECLDDPFYGDWIRGYASEEYAEFNKGLMEMTNRLTAGISEEAYEHLERIFVDCSRFETGFWDMAWNYGGTTK